MRWFPRSPLQWPRLLLLLILAGLILVRYYRPKRGNEFVFVIHNIRTLASFCVLENSPTFNKTLNRLNADPTTPQYDVYYLTDGICDDGISGRLYGLAHKIVICGDTPWMELDTIAHEVRHAEQIQFGEHDCSPIDFRPYNQRPCEIDAEQYADKVLAEVFEKENAFQLPPPSLGGTP